MQAQLKGQEMDPVRGATLASEISAAQKRIPDVIRQAWSVVVTMSAKGELEAFKVTLRALCSTIRLGAPHALASCIQTLAPWRS